MDSMEDKCLLTKYNDVSSISKPNRSLLPFFNARSPFLIPGGLHQGATSMPPDIKSFQSYFQSEKKYFFQSPASHRSDELFSAASYFFQSMIL